jgi:hypothetical protein
MKKPAIIQIAGFFFHGKAGENLKVIYVWELTSLRS